MKKYILGSFTILFSLITIGCGNNEEANEPTAENKEIKKMGYVSGQHPNDININTEVEIQEDQFPKRNTPKSDPDANSYNNKEYDKLSRLVAKRLTQSRYVKTAQVVFTNETVVVAVEEPDRATYTRLDVAEMVRDSLREMPETKGLEIVVYTDERYWDRMKDLRSRFNQDNEMPEEVDQFRNKYR